MQEARIFVGNIFYRTNSTVRRDLAKLFSTRHLLRSEEKKIGHSWSQIASLC